MLEKLPYVLALIPVERLDTGSRIAHHDNPVSEVCEIQVNTEFVIPKSGFVS